MPEPEVPLVAHVIHRLDVGGMENGLVNLINRMPAERYRHAVVCLDEQTSFRERIRRPDVSLFELGKKPGQDVGLFVRARRLFRRIRPALVHTRNLSAIEMTLPAFVAGVPFRVHGEHGRDIEDLHGTRLRYRALRRFLSPLVHRWIPLSRALESYLVNAVRVPASKIVRITNGVDTARFHPRANGRRPVPEGAPFDGESAFIVGSVTRMQEVKDPLTLARAFVELTRRGLGPRVRLVLVGDGPLLARVETVLREGDAHRYAWLTGRRDDVPRLLRWFDLFALSSRVEGISNTILEAMASGLPVVATRVGGNYELVVDGVTGSLVPAVAPEALADAIARYVEEPERTRVQGEAARKRAVENFSLDAMVSGYLSVYDALTRSRTCAG